MPNWCNNILTIRSEDSAFIDRIEAAYERGELLQTLMPQPEYPGYTDTEIKERDSGSHMPDWWNWRDANWGTKWDAYGHPQVFQAGNGALIYTFETAWSAPLPWLRAAVKRFSKLTFELWSRDEYPWCMSVLACHDEDAPNGIRWEECYGEMRVTKDGA